MTTQFRKKCTITSIGNIIKMPFIEYNYPEHKIKDCISDKRIHSPMSEDCIYGVTSQNGDRILLERFSIARPVPKVTLNSNRHSQEQQLLQSICHDVSTRRRESQNGTRDVRDYTTDDQTSTRRLVRNPKSTAEKKYKFEIDLRVEGVFLKISSKQDEEKMKEINENLGKLKKIRSSTKPIRKPICRKV